MITKINSLEEYRKEYLKSVESPEEFWSEIAKTFLWKKGWERVVDWDFNDLEIKWFEG